MNLVSQWFHWLQNQDLKAAICIAVLGFLLILTNSSVRQLKRGIRLIDRSAADLELFRTEFASLPAVDLRKKATDIVRADDDSPTRAVILSLAKRGVIDNSPMVAKSLVEKAESTLEGYEARAQATASSALYIGLLGTLFGLSYSVYSLKELAKQTLPEEIKNKILNVVSSFGTSFYSAAIGVAATIYLSYRLAKYEKKLRPYLEDLEGFLSEEMLPSFTRSEVTVEVATAAAQAAANEIAGKVIDPLLEKMTETTAKFETALSETRDDFTKALASEARSRERLKRVLGIVMLNIREENTQYQARVGSTVARLESLVKSLDGLSPDILKSCNAIQKSADALALNSSNLVAAADTGSKFLETTGDFVEKANDIITNIKTLIDEMAGSHEEQKQNLADKVETLVQALAEAANEAVETIEGQAQAIEKRDQDREETIRRTESSFLGAVAKVGDTVAEKLDEVRLDFSDQNKITTITLENFELLVSNFLDAVEKWEEVVQDYPAAAALKQSSTAIDLAGEAAESIREAGQTHAHQLRGAAADAAIQMREIDERAAKMMRAIESLVADLPVEVSQQVRAGLDSIGQDLTKVVEYLRKNPITRGRYKG